MKDIYILNEYDVNKDEYAWSVVFNVVRINREGKVKQTKWHSSIYVAEKEMELSIASYFLARASRLIESIEKHPRRKNHRVG